MRNNIALPTEISPDGREIWDWAHRFSHHVHTVDRIRKIEAELNAPERCGNCYLWMKSRLCPREYNDNGMCRGPSMNDKTCAKFQVTESATKHRAALVAERNGLAFSLVRHEDSSP